ncbi:MAG: hypothetical protein IT438_13640 [Phycisphaerales bacterium]|nr:hypothetical protein [Phycisphaerales bacterium]
MDLKHMKELHAARPFRPLTLHLADGRTRRVDHPELMAFLGNGRTVFLADPRNDSFEFIDLILIVSAEVGRAGNAGDRRRKSA